jgi:hypothetical protein
MMKKQVTSLHLELTQLYGERLELKDKLLAARTVQDTLKRIEEEQEDARAFLLNEDQLLAQAEGAFKMARDEECQLEESLQQEEGRLEVFLDSLEELRLIKLEEDASARADSFYATSRAVLKSAYSRFYSSVKLRLRFNRNLTISKLFRLSQVRRRCWARWLAYLYRHRFMVRCIESRQLETKVILFSRWKVYSALERHFRRMRRRRLLRMVFDLIRAHRDACRWQRWALTASRTFGEKQEVRRVFGAWKKQCMFLEWSSQYLKVAERRGARHLASRVMRLWLAAAKRDKAFSVALVNQVVLIKLRKRIIYWRNLTRGYLNRRAELKSRFFWNLRQLVEGRTAGERQMRTAMSLCIGIKKLTAFRRWERFLRSRLRNGTTRKWSHSLGYKRRRLLETAMLMLIYNSALCRRITCATLAATLHHTQGVIQFWRSIAVHRVARRRTKRIGLLRSMFESWTAFVPLQRRRARIDEGTERLFLKSGINHQVSFLRRWHCRAQRLRRLRIGGDRVLRRERRTTLQQTFSAWRRAWGYVLLWRTRENKLEYERSRALNELRTDEVRHLEDERDELLRNGREMLGALSELQRTVVVQQEELTSKRQELEDAHSLKGDLERTVDEMGVELSVVRRERERLRAVEDIIETERQRGEALVHQRKQHAETIVRGLQEESATLKEEVKQAREQAYLVERSAKRDLLLDSALLTESRATSEQLKELVVERRRQLVELEQTISGLQGDVGRLHSRMQETSREGISLLDEGERELRRRSSSVNALRASRGQTEARVQALREIVRERRRRVDDALIQGTALAEAR